MSSIQSTIDNTRFWAQKNILLRLQLYKYYKDNYKGANERDILRIVRRWTSQQKYDWNAKELKCRQSSRLKTCGYALFGFVFPFGFLITPTLRQMIVNTNGKRIAFSCFAFFLGYANYIQAQAMSMQSYLNLNDSVISYCLFQVMLQPQFKHMRNTWQSQYNLSHIAHRYQKFDLDQRMMMDDLTLTLN